MQQQRYFIGMTLPPDLSKIIASIQHELYIPNTMLLPLSPHITLLEPSLLSQLPADDFIPRVKEVADKFLPLDLTLNYTSLFGNHVLYIAVQNDTLAALEKRLLDLLSSATYEGIQANRPFQAHVTIAQAKPGQVLPLSLINNFKEYIDPLLPQKFIVNELAYFQWIHPRTYALYEI